MKETHVILAKISATKRKGRGHCQRHHFHSRTVGQNSQKYRLQYWATHSSVRSFAHTAHLFARSGLLASLAPSAVLTRLLARSLPRSWETELLDGYFVCFFPFLTIVFAAKDGGGLSTRWWGCKIRVERVMPELNSLLHICMASWPFPQLRTEKGRPIEVVVGEKGIVARMNIMRQPISLSVCLSAYLSYCLFFDYGRGRRTRQIRKREKNRKGN